MSRADRHAAWVRYVLDDHVARLRAQFLNHHPPAEAVVDFLRAWTIARAQPAPEKEEAA